MQTHEILQEISGLTRGFMSERSIKSRETKKQAEERQAGMLAELFDILTIDPEELVDVAVKTVTKLLKKQHYAVVSLMVEKVIAHRLRPLIEGREGGEGLTPRLLGLMVCTCYLQHVSGFHLCVKNDEQFFAKATAHACLGHLQGVAAAMEKLLTFEEELYHVIFNGTVHLYEGALILMRNGFLKEAMLFLGFAAKCCDCTLLSQVRYLPWKVRLHLTLSLGYSSLGHVDHSEAVLKRGMDEVKELYELETSDPVPPPPATLAALRACALQLQIPLFKLAIHRSDRGDGEAVETAPGGKVGKGKAPAAGNAAGLTAEGVLAQVKATLVGLDQAEEDPVACLRALLACVGDGAAVTAGGAAAVLSAIDTHLEGLDDPPVELCVEYAACLYAHHVSGGAERRAAGVPLREKWFNITGDFLQHRGMVDPEFDLHRRLFELSLISPTEIAQSAAAYQAVCGVLDDAVGPVVDPEAILAPAPAPPAIKPKVMTDAAMHIYNTLTNKGDDAVIKHLELDGFWKVFETVGLVLVHVRHPDIVFTAGVCLLFAKWCEEKAEGLKTGKRQYYVRSIDLLKRLARLVADRRGAFIRNSQNGNEAKRRSGIYSRSLLYKTLETQHGLIEAALLTLQLKLGRVQLKAKLHKQQRDRLVPLRQRQDQSHIFGEPSAKELEIIQHEESKVIEVPSSNEETEMRLLREREGNPCCMALACIAISNFAPNQKAAQQHLDTAQQHIYRAIEAQQQLEGQLRRDKKRLSSGTVGGTTVAGGTTLRGDSSLSETGKAGASNLDPNCDVLLTTNGFPVDFLWGLLAKAALQSKHYSMVFHAAQLLREKYVVIGEKDTHYPNRPAEPLWANNPMNCDILRKELIVHVPTPLLEVVAGAFIAAADARTAAKAVPAVPAEFKDDPEQSFDVLRYEVLDVQWERMDNANLLLVALMLAVATKTTSLVVQTCHKLFSCLLPLLRVANPPPCLLRPLWALAQTLSKLEGAYLSTAEHQALCVRTMGAVFAILKSREAPEVVKGAVDLLAAMWKRTTANPNDFIKRRVTRLVDYAAIFGGGAPEAADANAKPDKKKGGKPPPAGGGGGGDDPPAHLPTKTPTQADVVPMEFIDLLEDVVCSFPDACAVLAASHTEEEWLPPIYATALGQLHTAPGAVLEELAANFKTDALYPRLAVRVCEQALRQRVPNRGALVEQVLAVLKDRSKGLLGLQGQVMAAFDEKLAAAKKGEEPAAAAPPAKGAKGKPPTPPQEVDPAVKKQKETEQLMKVAGLALLRRRRLLQLRNVKLGQLCQDSPFRAQLFEMQSVVALRAAEEAKKLTPVPEALETPEEIAEYWKNEIAAVQHLARSSTLYARLGRWKHVYNVMNAASNLIHTLFPHIPLCMPAPDSCRPPDPALQPTPRISFREEERPKGVTFEDFIPLVRKELVALLGNVVFCAEAVAAGDVDLIEYLDGLSAAAVELKLFPSGETVAASTALQLATRAESKLALATARETPDPVQQQMMVAFRREEFEQRAAAEKEEEEERAALAAACTSEAEKLVYDDDTLAADSPRPDAADGSQGGADGVTETCLAGLGMVEGVDVQAAGGVTYAEMKTTDRAALTSFLYAYHQQHPHAAPEPPTPRPPEEPPADPSPQRSGKLKSTLKRDATAKSAKHGDDGAAARAAPTVVVRSPFAPPPPHGTALVHDFPLDVYDRPDVKLLVNVRAVGSLARCWEEKNGAIKIGITAAPRRVVTLLNAAKQSQAKWRTVGASIAHKPRLDLQDFRALNTKVEVFDVAGNVVKYVGLRDVLNRQEEGDRRWFPLAIVVSPPQGDGAQSTLFRLSAKETSFDAQAALDNRPATALQPGPAAGGKAAKPKPAEEEGFAGVLARMGTASFGNVIDFVTLLLRCLQWSSGTRGLTSLSAVDYGERINKLSQNKFATEIIPLVMTLQSVAGRPMRQNEIILKDVYRDLPRAIVLVRSGEVGLAAYQASTAWTIAMEEAEKVRTGSSMARGSAAPSVTIRSIATSKSSAARSGLKNDFYFDVAARFKTAYTFLRAKHQTLMAMKVCLTVGQLHKAHLNHKEASIAWQDGVDIAFGQVHAVQKWRDITHEPPGAPSLVAKVGTSKLLLAVILLYKQASQSLVSKQTAAREHCMLAARLCKAVLSPCVSQPVRSYDFSAQLPHEVLWAADVFTGPLGVDGKLLLHALAYVAAFCQRIGHDLMSIPVACLLEHVASKALRNMEYVVLARCFRIRGLAGIGNIEAAAEVLASVLNVVDIPHTWLMQVGVFERGVDAGAEPSQSAGGKKPAAKKAAGKATPSVPEGGGEARPKLSNAKLPDRAAKGVVEQLMGRLPVALQGLDASLQRFFILTQVTFLVKLAEGHPFASLAVNGKPAALPASDALNEAREVYASLLALANTLAQGVEEQCGAGNASHRTHLAMGMALRAQAAAVRGDLAASLDILNALLNRHAEWEGMATSLAGVHCDTLVGSLTATDVAAWLLLKARVLLDMRRPAESMAACADCIALARQQGDLVGELEGKLVKAQCMLASGHAAESYALLTEPQTSEQKAVGDVGEGRGLPEIGCFARVAAPTRLRNAPDTHAAVVQGGGLLEGMPVTVLQVDHDWTLVRSDEGAQGFMVTKDLRPGVQFEPPPPPLKPRAAMLTEARGLGYDAHDTLLMRLVAMIICAAQAHLVKGKEDADITLLYLDERPPPPPRKPSQPVPVEDIPLPTLFELKRELAALYSRHVAHMGFVSQLHAARWEKLFNKHVPAAREAALACVNAGNEMARRDRLKEAMELFEEAHLISNQTLDVHPQGRSVVLFHLARCRRAVATPPWFWCGFELGAAPAPQANASATQQQAMDVAAKMPGVLPQVVADLLTAIELTATKGTYDFELLRCCLLELSVVFGSWGPAVEEEEGVAVAVAAHCLRMACVVYQQAQAVTTPQLADPPMLNESEEGRCAIVEPGADGLAVATRADVDEHQRRLNTSQCQFNNKYPQDSAVPSDPKAKAAPAAGGGDANAEINGTLAAPSFMMWYAEALKEVRSQPLFARAAELRLANWRETLQTLAPPAGQAPAIWTPAAPQLQKILEVDGRIAEPGFASQLYTSTDTPLPHKPAKPGEPVTTAPTLPPLHWFLALSDEEDGEIRHTYARLVTDQREVRTVRAAARRLRGILAALIEREDELAALAGGAADAKAAAPAKGKGKAGEPVANAPVALADRTADIEALDEELEQASIAFAEATCAMLQTTFRAAAAAAECPFSDPLTFHYPPISATETRTHNHHVALLLCQLFDVRGGCSTAGQSPPGMPEVLAWLLNLVRSLHPEPESPGGDDAPAAPSGDDETA